MSIIPAEVTSSLKKRILRFDELIPCKTAFIDTRTPGSDQKENFCLIGGGVAENPGQVIHINIPHGFDIGAARQPKGCKNSHHSHDTEEVFVVHKGQWKFTWGEEGLDGEAVLDEGDTISIPKHLFRGFENVGCDDGLLFCALGHHPGGSAGHVIWAPYVIAKAKNYGLVLLEDGRLIDTAAGEKIPEDGVEYRPVEGEELAAFRHLTLADMQECIERQESLGSAPRGGLSHLNGVMEYSVVGKGSDAEQIPPGKMGWSHGFQLRRLHLEPDTVVPKHSRIEEEVLFVHKGTLDISTTEGDFTLNSGDLFTCPKGMSRSFINSGDQLADIIVVRGGDAPQPACFA